MLAFTRLRIQGFKSLQDVDLRNVGAFTVFAGANGSGKSNLADALELLSNTLRSGFRYAADQLGGQDAVFSRSTSGGTRMAFLVTAETNVARPASYELSIARAGEPIMLREKFNVAQEDGRPLEVVRDGQSVTVSIPDGPEKPHIILAPREDLPVAGALALQSNMLPVLNAVEVLRVEPNGAKSASRTNVSSSRLWPNGGNLSAVLDQLLKTPEHAEAIRDWVKLLVPGAVDIKTVRNPLDGSAVWVLAEDQEFPSHLISDGTAYVLSILAAVLARPSTPCLTVIEEPERGLHPKAQMELVGFLREYATELQPIWLTTHSESVVRQLRPQELWLVEKKHGATQIHRAADPGALNLSEAWLANALPGGLPW